MQNKSSSIRPLPEIIRDLRRAFSDNKYSQIEAARVCLLNQSQVSRLLDGKCVRVSKGLLRLCIYASVSVYEDNLYDPAEDASLMGALREAVGNSSVRARQIERVMRALVEV